MFRSTNIMLKQIHDQNIWLFVYIVLIIPLNIAVMHTLPLIRAAMILRYFQVPSTAVKCIHTSTSTNTDIPHCTFVIYFNWCIENSF